MPIYTKVLQPKNPHNGSSTLSRFTAYGCFLLCVTLFSTTPQAAEPGFPLNFQTNPNVSPRSKPSLVRTDMHQWQIASGCCTKGNIRITGQTPWLMQDSWLSNGQEHWQLPEVVSIGGLDYYHMLMGSEADGFIQEVYIPLGYPMNFGGVPGPPSNSPVTWAWAVNQYTQCGNSTTCNLWHSASGGDSYVVAGGSIGPIREAGNARYPLVAPTGKNTGNGTGNPNRVLIRQKMTSGDFSSEFLKDSFGKKPKITQTIDNADLRIHVVLDMTNSNYNTSLAGNMTNTLDFKVGEPIFVASSRFNAATDVQAGRSNVTAGRYTYTAGTGAGGANGTYTYAEGGFDGRSLDWGAFFDHSQANPWSFEENKPAP